MSHSRPSGMLSRWSRKCFLLSETRFQKVAPSHMEISWGKLVKRLLYFFHIQSTPTHLCTFMTCLLAPDLNLFISQCIRFLGRKSDLTTVTIANNIPWHATLQRAYLSLEHLNRKRLVKYIWNSVIDYLTRGLKGAMEGPHSSSGQQVSLKLVLFLLN